MILTGFIVSPKLEKIKLEKMCVWKKRHKIETEKEAKIKLKHHFLLCVLVLSDGGVVALLIKTIWEHHR